MKKSIVELLNILNLQKGSVLININNLISEYNNVKDKKIYGTIGEDGKIIDPWVDTEYVNDSDYVALGSFETNKSSATINVKIRREINLVNRETREVIDSVAGIPLSLYDFKQYTVIDHGRLNIKSVTLKFVNEQSFVAVKNTGVVDGHFSPEKEYLINFEEMTLMPVDFQIDFLDSFERFAKISTLNKIFNALCPGKRENYSEEQINELKRHYLSPSLYLSFPTVSQDQKVSNEEDITNRNVKIGSIGTLSVEKLKSANAFLDRIYQVEIGRNGPVSKPKMDAFLDPKCKITHKILGSRFVFTDTDRIQKSVFDEFFNLSDQKFLRSVSPELADLVCSETYGQELIDKLSSLADDISNEEEKIWTNNISPLVFFVGATGELPHSLSYADKMSAEELINKYPEVSISKSEKSSTFFVFDDIVVSISEE